MSELEAVYRQLATMWGIWPEEEARKGGKQNRIMESGEERPTHTHTEIEIKID